MRDFWAPPADSADFESYTALTLRRAPLPAFGCAVPARKAYSPMCPGVRVGGVEVLSLPHTRGSWRKSAVAAPVAAARRPQASACLYDFLSGPQFVCLMSTPLFAFALVWLIGLL
jgi:hypothetical protein